MNDLEPEYRLANGDVGVFHLNEEDWVRLSDYEAVTAAPANDLDIAAERVLFENDVRAIPDVQEYAYPDEYLLLALQRCTDGDYSTTWVQARWEGWQAAKLDATTPSQAPAAPVQVPVPKQWLATLHNIRRNGKTQAYDLASLLEIINHFESRITGQSQKGLGGGDE